ncbi:hypothetical protein HDA40_002655 [Hamadaea flava]|uniref:HEAT repeat domain-containing protein n=1 Tax=Hamadaea flava TaxID=1742688 RepID=A0ABV8LL44_9ACTN|nr:HEAT repeat domain-containing protein [Hamadaea flava]MCP2324148.1 hypothetical protein [Hamadaea flava]
MVDRILELIGQLDDDSTDVAEGAKHGLMAIGLDVIDPLIDALPESEFYGQLSAIEVFEYFGDVRAAGVLTELLSSESSTVREWAAWALVDIGSQETVAALQDAYNRFRASGDDPDFTEAVALRRSLTRLGGRQEVLPPLTGSLCQSVGILDRVWPSARLAEVIDELAACNQVVLYLMLWTVTDRGIFMLWTVTDRGIFGSGHESSGWCHDRSLGWPDLVASARDAAVLELAFTRIGDNVYATLEWIDQSDL